MKPLVVTALLVSVTTVAAAAPAADVAFHGLQTLNVEAEISEHVRASLRARVGSFEAPQEQVADRCKADVLCHCNAARERGAARVMFGQVARLSDLYTIELLLVGTHDCRVENAVFASERLSAGDVATRVDELAAELIRPAESVSTTAVKSKRDVDLTPAVVTVMSREQLTDYGAHTLDDVFPLIPGYEIVEANWGTRVLHQGLPGTTLVVIDGVPILDPSLHFEALSRELALSLNHVERIEFVRGPGSVIWGSSALLGIVNITTRIPQRKATHAEVVSRLGSSGTHEIAGRVERTWPTFRLALSGTLRRDRDPALFIEDSLYASQRLDDDQAVLWGASGTTDNHFDSYFDLGAYLAVANRVELRLQHYAYRSYFEVSPFGSLLDADAPGYWDRSHRLLQLTWNEQLTDATRTTLTASRYEVTAEENFAIHPRHPMGYADGIRAVQGNAAEPTVNHLVEGRVQHTRLLAGMVHRLVAGSSLYLQTFPDSYATLVGMSESATPAELDIRGSTFRTIAAFAHDEIQVRKRLHLTGGLRWEHHSPYSSWLGSQAALLLSTRPIGGKLLFAEGFRPPVANDLLSTVGTEGNPDLRPERSRALMLELDAQPVEAARFKAGAAVTRIEDVIVHDPDAASPGFVVRPVNGGEIDVLSLFAEARGRLSEEVGGYVAYSFKAVSESDPERDGHAIAPHTLAAAATWRPLNDVVGSVVTSFSSGRTIEAMVPGTTDSGRRELAPTLNLRASLRLTNLYDGFDVELTLDNPFRVPTYTPYEIDGSVSPLVERRTASELLLSVRYAP